MTFIDTTASDQSPEETAGNLLRAAFSALSAVPAKDWRSSAFLAEAQMAVKDALTALQEAVEIQV